MCKTESISRNYAMGFKDILYSLVFERIGEKVNINVLDIGCKDGTDLLYICNARGCKGYGLDMYFRKTWNNLGQHFVQGMAEEIPFRKNMIDIIIASEIIEHISELNKFLHEVSRVLKNDGYFFITTSSRYNYVSLIGKFVPYRFKKSLRKLVYYRQCEKDGIKQILPDGTIVKTHVHEYIPGEMKRLLRKNGFETEVIRQGFLHVPLCPLFDKFPSLLRFWGVLDGLISKFPFSIHLKANFIVVAKKYGK